MRWFSQFYSFWVWYVNCRSFFFFFFPFLLFFLLTYSVRDFFVSAIQLFCLSVFLHFWFSVCFFFSSSIFLIFCMSVYLSLFIFLYFFLFSFFLRIIAPTLQTPLPNAWPIWPSGQVSCPPDIRAGGLDVVVVAVGGPRTPQWFPSWLVYRLCTDLSCTRLSNQIDLRRFSWLCAR